MVTYLGIVHFAIEFYVFLICFSIAFISWQLYLRQRNIAMLLHSLGFTSIGLTGLIHSANLQGDAYLGLMFLGRILGYILIAAAIYHPDRTAIRFRSFFPSIMALRSPLYTLAGLICAFIAYQSYKDYKTSRTKFTGFLSIAFAALAVSEIQFAFSGLYDLNWSTAHGFKLIGFTILGYSFLKLPRLKIQDKLYTILRNLVLLTVAIASVPITTVLVRNLETEVLQRTETQLRRILDSIEQDKQIAIANAKLIAMNQTVIQSLNTNREKELKSECQRMEQETNVNFIIIFNAQQHLMAQVTTETLLMSSPNTWWLIQKAGSGQNVVALIEGSNSRLLIAAAVPIKAKEKIIGIAVAGYDLNDKYLERISKKTQIAASFYLWNRIVATTVYGSKRTWSEEMPSILNTVYTHRKIYYGRVGNGDSSYYASISPLLGTHLQPIGMVFTGIPAHEIELQRDALLIVIAIIAVLVVLLSHFFAWYMSRGITHDIELLSAGAWEVMHGNLNVKLPVTGGDELAELAMVFNDMTAKLKEIDQIKSDFFSFMSHELRTPLTAILGAASVMRDEVAGEVSESQAISIRRIIKNTERLSRLITDWLDIAKMEAGKMSFNFQALDMNQLINDALLTFAPLAKENQVELQFTPLAKPTKLHADPDRITQVLVNLLSNAIKFTEPKGKIRITESLQNITEFGIPLTFLEVRVSDNGVGIPKEHLETIFDKFHSVHLPQEHKPNGTGLGLAISRLIIESHHGKIWAESKPGQGSTFIFRLPLE
ncbi:MAG: ATP-binding protein [bacterium]|nr:ATP-binding protein [bacterium]